MPSKILLIENDAAFAGELARALEARGLTTRVTGDGKEGLELARDDRPDAIVLCVELPRMSGYSVCQKLRKDDGLRTIPLVLTSAEATEETFEAHRKLKARADEYLVKPFRSGALLEKLSRLLALPEPAGAGEELVTLDDVEELSGEIPLIPAGERVKASDALPDQDEDMKLLDDAFDHLAGQAPPSPPPRAAPPPAPSPRAAEPQDDERPMARDELRAAAELLPAGDERAAHAEIDKLGEEADAALAALGADESGPAPELSHAAAALDEPPPGPRLTPPAFAQPPETRLSPPPFQPPPEVRSSPVPFQAPPEVRLAGAVPPASRLTPAPFTPPGSDADAEIRRLQDRVSQLLIDLARAHDGASADTRALQDAHQRALEEVGAESRREGEARRAADERARAAEDRARAAEEAARRAEEAQRAAEEALRKAETDARALEDAVRAAEEGRAAAEEQQRKVGERAGMLEAEVATLRLRAEETEQGSSLQAAQLADALSHHATLGQKVADLEAELTGTRQAHAGHLEGLQGELTSSRTALETHRAESDRRVEELTRRVSELEAVNARHEERVVKAYQKIKSDEKIREKTRKALAIALQLLDERLAGAAPPADKPGEPPPRRE